MSKREESLESKVQRLEGDVEVLVECIEMLCGNCNCTVRERISGHHVDCNVPHILAVLKPEDAEPDQGGTINGPSESYIGAMKGAGRRP